jgi:ankyrin repeat protein
MTDTILYVSARHCFKRTLTSKITPEKSDTDQDARDAYGDSLLNIACACGHYDMAQYLLEQVRRGTSGPDTFTLCCLGDLVIGHPSS